MPTKTTKKPKPVTKPAPEANGAVLVENMTLAEAAVWLRVSEDGLKADAVAGRIPARFVAGEWRFNKPALVAWLSVPEPPSNRPKTGAELVERIRQIGAGPTYQDDPEAAEAEIAELYKLRKQLGSGA